MRCGPALVLAVVLAAGCSGANGAGGTAAADPDGAVRLRHQIMVRYGERAEVFEGYMIRRGDAFFVRAFAGPGVDLFTVIRDGATQRGALHIAGLADRIDLEKVGADIARAYLGGCAPAPDATVSCDHFGEPLTETFDGAGRLLERRFPAAHGIGITVGYGEYRPFGDGQLAGRISLDWGDGAGSMVIVLLDAEQVGAVDPAALPVED